MKLIINADDCGMSKNVDSHIKQAIEKGKITSTTIMANMSDFEGAIQLYKDCHKDISFGWHMNLTEGQPLLYSQPLLDCGFYKEDGGNLEMNGKAFWKKLAKPHIKNEVIRELNAQYEKIRDYGIEISHVDSHHHFHTSPFMLFVFPHFIKDKGITKVRRIRTNVRGNLIDKVSREMWCRLVKAQNKKIQMADCFCSFKSYINYKTFYDNCLLELECHPGHPKYIEEEKMLMETDFHHNKNIRLVNYNKI